MQWKLKAGARVVSANDSVFKMSTPSNHMVHLGCKSKLSTAPGGVVEHIYIHMTHINKGLCTVK